MNNKLKVIIWDREFELGVIYHNFPGEEVTDDQERTVKAILDTDFTMAKVAVEKYIKKNNSEELNGDEITNLFRYVMPKSLLVSREHSRRIFAVMCNYKFDMEHGLAIVYENEKYKSVGPQDIIL